MQPILDKSDLIRFESMLKDSLSSLFSFSSYSLYFPREIPDGMKQGQDIIPIIEKDRSLLPLMVDDRFLGVFLAKGTDSSQMKLLKDHLKIFTSLSLEKLILHKQCMLDQLTGLFNHDQFCGLVQKEVEAVLSSITPGPEATMDNGQSQHSGSFCVMVLNLDEFKGINHTFGFSFADKILVQLASCLKNIIPEQAVLSRLHGDNFALFWPQTSQKKCLELARSITRKIPEIIFEFDVSGEKVSLTASTGASFFPQDIKGPQFRKSSYELSSIILEKAKQAMLIAKENGRNRAYSFGGLLSQGGVVMESLPLNRLVINLGKNVDVCEGQKFMVWSRKFNGHSEVIKEPENKAMGHYPPIHKGEITILEVQDRISIAEVLYLNDPGWEIESGDKLSLLQEKDSLLEKEGLGNNDTPQKDILTGLYSYRDFISLWNRQRSASQSFCLAMLKIKEEFKDKNEQGIQGENLVLEIVKSLRNKLPQETIGGRYSSTCLIFYIPDMPPDQLTLILKDLSTETRQQHEILIHSGLASFPCLNFSRIDILENCRKSLEHAGLKDFPYVAAFDSVTLTISADRLFTRGDTFSAMEEYKTALAADESNTLARNSLAICYARLGRLGLARKYFKEITDMEEQNLMAWYNLACVSLKQDEIQDAENGFLKCLEIDPGHAFSLFRMGQLAEKNNSLDKAEKFYNQARQTPDGQSMAPRHLARLAWKKEQKEEARELLHQALVNNPRDAFSLNLMARIYLESGDDPQIAESLARQSVALRPDVSKFWLDLADCLEIQGREQQAGLARARAFG
ncbi:MAG: diguanylate cyclase [Desulfonatronovibrio sp.]